MLIDPRDLAAARHIARRITAMHPNAVNIDVIMETAEAAIETHEATNPELVQQLADWLGGELYAARDMHGGNLAAAINDTADKIAAMFKPDAP